MAGGWGRVVEGCQRGGGGDALDWVGRRCDGSCNVHRSEEGLVGCLMATESCCCDSSHPGGFSDMDCGWRWLQKPEGCRGLRGHRETAGDGRRQLEKVRDSWRELERADSWGGLKTVGDGWRRLEMVGEG